MELQLLADSLYVTYRLVISVYDEETGELCPLHNEVYEKKKDEIEELYMWVKRCCNEKCSDYFLSQEQYAWTALYCKEQLYVVGPVKTFLSFSKLDKSLGHNSEKDSENTPTLPMMEFIRLCGHIMHMINGKVTQTLDFLLNHGTDSISIRDDVAYTGQLKDYSASQKAYQSLQECVKNGDVELLGRMELYNVPSPALVANEERREAQNMFIISLTIVCHAAISGGLPEEIAYPLSDEYMMRNESMKNVSQIWDLLRTCVLDYTQRVRSMKSLEEYSDIVTRCRSYVMGHPMENLKIRDIAESIGVNAEHLARQFKKETGQSLLGFIHMIKIRSAKQLLRYSDMTVVEISTRLGFSSQSQFAVQFKHETGMTPGQFRRRRDE